MAQRSKTRMIPEETEKTTDLTTDVAEGVIHDQALELWKMVVETMSHGRGKPATSAAAGYKATTQVHKSRAS